MKKRFQILTILSALLLLLVGCGGNSDTKKTAEKSEEVNTKQVIKVGMDGETPPYSTVNDKGELVGFEVDVWNEIGKRIGYEIKFERMEFSTLFGLLDDGRLDTIANLISVTPDRKEIYNFGSPYQYEKAVLVSKADKEISSINDLNGMTIAVEPTSSDVSIVDAFEKEKGIKMERTFYDGASIQDVVLGRVDLWIKGETGAAEVIEQIGGDKLKVLADTEVFFESAYPFAKTEKGDKLRKLSNKALKEMREDGTLTKISKKYFDVDVTQK
jgi:ABC-type amino acid transport substrate-binding protein